MNLPVCAIVVTYHPEPLVRKNLQRLLELFPQVILVDNGSKEEELDSALPDDRQRLHVIRNLKNLGIAKALNQGIEEARAMDFGYVVLFDQDSYPPLPFLERMWTFLIQHPLRDKIGVVIPRYWQESVNSFLPAVMGADGCIELPMTSGSLCALSTFSRCGPMREDFFIDMVDYDFAFRVRDAGLLILECPTAHLDHSVASPIPFRLFGKTLCYPSHYSADRRYYSTRNKLVLFRAYGRRYPRATWILFRSEIADRLKMLIGEKQRMVKLRAVFQGAKDAFTGRLGPRFR